MATQSLLRMTWNDCSVPLNIIYIHIYYIIGLLSDHIVISIFSESILHFAYFCGLN